MFKAGWALLEQIKIDTLPYCFLKAIALRMCPAFDQQLPHASTAPLILPFLSLVAFKDVLEILWFASLIQTDLSLQ